MNSLKTITAMAILMATAHFTGSFAQTASAQNGVLRVNDFYQTITDKCRVRGNATLDTRTGKLTFKGTIKNRGRIAGHTGYVGIRVYDRNGQRIGSYWSTRGINATFGGSPKVKSISINTQIPKGAKPHSFKVMAGKAVGRPADFKNAKPKQTAHSPDPNLAPFITAWNYEADNVKYPGNGPLVDRTLLRNLSSRVLRMTFTKNGKSETILISPYGGHHVWGKLSFIRAYYAH